MDIDRFGRILEAAAGHEAVVMLVDRRGHDQLAAHVSHDAAGKHVGTGRRIAVVDGEDHIIDAEDRDLQAVDERAHA